MRYLIFLIAIMAITCVKNQPVTFPSDFDCDDIFTDNYCLPVEQGDDTLVYVELSPIDSVNIITNGTFASATGWTLAGGAAIASGVATIPSGGTLSRDTDSILATGYYRLTFDMVAGTGASPSLTITIGSEPTVIVNAELIGETITIFKYLTNPASTSIIFFNPGGDTVVIDNMTMVVMSSIGYEIKDCDTDTVYYTNDLGSEISYFNTPTVSYSTVNDVGRGVITINWNTGSMAPLPDGCYCLCLLDSGLIGYELIQNPSFTSAENYVIANSGAAGWAITGGQAVHTSEAAAGTDVITQTLLTALSATSCYRLNLSHIVIGSATFTILYDTATLTDQTLGTVVGTGTGTTGIDINELGITAIKIRLPDTTNATLDSISLTVREACLDCVCESRCISLKTNHDILGMCNYLLTGVSSIEAFGFKFSNPAFHLQGRVFGKIRHAKYPTPEEIIYKNSSSLKALIYAESEKTEELVIYQVPGYAHDWIRLAMLCDTFTIERDGVTKTFIKAGDYLPDHRKTSSQAPVIVEIQEVQQLPGNQYV